MTTTVIMLRYNIDDFQNLSRRDIDGGSKCVTANCMIQSGVVSFMPYLVM